LKIFPYRPKPLPARKGAERSERFGGRRLRSVSARRAGLAAGLIAVLVGLYVPLGTTKVFLPAEGQIAKEDVLAPFDFPVLKDDEDLRKERDQKAAEVLPVVRLDDEATREIELRVRDFFLSVERIIDSGEDLDARREEMGGLGAPLTDSAREVLLDVSGESRIRRETIAFLEEVFERGVLETKGIFADEGTRRVDFTREGEEYTLGLDAFLDLRDVRVEAARRAEESFGEDRAPGNAFYEVVAHFAAPNLFLDEEETGRRREEHRAAVPTHTDIYLKGQKIIGAHERVTKNHLSVLRSLERRMAEEQIEASRWRGVYPHLGRGVATLVVLVLFLIYLRRQRPAVYGNDGHLMLLASLALLGIGLTALVSALELSLYLIPVAFVAMLATLLFDDHVGAALTGAFVFVVALVEGLPLPFLFTIGVAGAAAVYGVAGLRERKRFWYSLLWVAAAYVASIGATDLLLVAPGPRTLEKIGFGLLGALGSAGLAMIALPLLEAGFRVTTSVKLLELSDLNRPLLKNMALLAPGTYHHSIMVGNLAEGAAERIGANSLLARVGAYYHDIGKMTKPDYFVENQIGGENKHDRISPRLSALVLISHVREGLELARKERLPAEIQGAIVEHHGTTMMAYFYEKARQAAPDGEVSEEEYRYPGPMPRTKENGIVMLADVAEAATRALVDPTPGRIRQRILDVTRAKFLEGQLDDSDLTFRELRLIQESFVPILTSAMHPRIRYPDEVRRGEGRSDRGGLLAKSSEAD
jgi:putative nucleotidyltransferase with HDIG domain